MKKIVLIKVMIILLPLIAAAIAEYNNSKQEKEYEMVRKTLSLNSDLNIARG